MGARQYSARLGRFIEQDPVESGSANDYDYVRGDPVNSSDISGKCPECAMLALLSALAFSSSSPAKYEASLRTVRSTQIAAEAISANIRLCGRSSCTSQASTTAKGSTRREGSTPTASCNYQGANSLSGPVSTPAGCGANVGPSSAGVPPPAPFLPDGSFASAFGKCLFYGVGSALGGPGAMAWGCGLAVLGDVGDRSVGSENGPISNPISIGQVAAALG